MLFGFVVPINLLLLLGLTLFVLISFQIALGKRWIKFEGRTHWKVHRYNAYLIFVLGAVHGLLALTFAGYIRIG